MWKISNEKFENNRRHNNSSPINSIESYYIQFISKLLLWIHVDVDSDNDASCNLFYSILFDPI